MVGFFLPLSHWYLDETVLTWPQGMTKEGLRVVATRRLSFISPLTYSEVVFKLTWIPVQNLPAILMVYWFWMSLISTLSWPQMLMLYSTGALESGGYWRGQSHRQS